MLDNGIRDGLTIDLMLALLPDKNTVVAPIKTAHKPKTGSDKRRRKARERATQKDR